MRLNPSALGLLFPVAALLTGCGMGTTGSPVSAAVRPSKAITGKAYGGQSPVANGTIALYAFGSSGYGSGAAPIVTVQSGADGYFTIDPASITCPTPNTPVYIASIGGDPGSGQNSAIFEASALGPCVDAANDFVTINEISTAALAFEFSHFFSAAPVSGDMNTNDHFGAPASAAQTVVNGNSTIYTMLDVTNGYPHANTSTFKFEGPKIITIGNILGTCVNSTGPSSGACSSLFSNIAGPGGAKPTNILEAAVYLALNPLQNVSSIYNLQPPSGGAAFDGGLSAAPNDWSLSLSFTSPTFALGVDTRTTSTIDIDSAGRVWFPSNGSGKAGVGFFDPSTGTFSPLFTSAGLQHPQEVAIDLENYAWVTDSASANIAGFPGTSPTTPTALSLPGTVSTAVTVAYDDTLRFGIVVPNGDPALAEVTGKNTYSVVPGTEIGGAAGFIASSLAGDVVGGVGVGGQELRTPTTYDLYYSPNGQVTPVTYQTYQDSGQVVFTNSNFVGTRGGYVAQDDGICIWSARGCYSMQNQAIRHPSGLSLDGAGALWLADQGSNTVEQIPLVNGSYITSGNLANNLVYIHNTDNGGTLPGPTGIAVDGLGNVWVSNFGCYGTSCTPGNFTLSELIGLGTPTITPVSRQVVIDNLAGTEPQVKSGTASRK